MEISVAKAFELPFKLSRETISEREQELSFTGFNLSFFLSVSTITWKFELQRDLDLFTSISVSNSSP